MSHKVWSDIKNNRIYIKTGLLELERVEEMKEKIEKEILNLKKNFSCIADFSNFKADFNLISPDLLKTYSYYLKWLTDAGMDKMVWVVEPQIFMLSMIIRENFKKGSLVSYVDTMERAKLILKNKK
jgi:hypothetical protein